MSLAQAKLIVVEGPDGVGKSTLAEALAVEMRRRSVEVDVLSFPGRESGTLGAHVYQLHHDPASLGVSQTPSAEANQLLHIAAHLDAISNRILPALAAGRWVVLDRFWWSTMVYGRAAGATKSALTAMIKVELEAWQDVRPACLFLVDRDQSFRDTEASEWPMWREFYKETAAEQEGEHPIERIHNEGAVADAVEDMLRHIEGLPGGDEREPLSVCDYDKMVRETDQSDLEGLDAVSYALFGLHGEVGSLLSVLKKKHREGTIPQYHRLAMLEELGDVLWYLTSLAHQLDYCLQDIIGALTREGSGQAKEQGNLADLQGVVAADVASFPNRRVTAAAGSLIAELAPLLVDPTGTLLQADREKVRCKLARLLAGLLELSSSTGLPLDEIGCANRDKAYGFWPSPDLDFPVLFDGDDHPDEQLPRQMDFNFIETDTGSKVFVTIKSGGFVVGDRLTDNMHDEDGYRFHDCFHFAYAAVLGWSPVLRALLKKKRKRKPKIDEVEDGQRAIIIEEGVSTWVFNHAKSRGDYFEGVDRLDYSLLKQIRRLVLGLESETCPPWLWSRAILQGFEVFRLLRQNHGGRVRMDLNSRTISYLGPVDEG